MTEVKCDAKCIHARNGKCTLPEIKLESYRNFIEGCKHDYHETEWDCMMHEECID